MEFKINVTDERGYFLYELHFYLDIDEVFIAMDDNFSDIIDSFKVNENISNIEFRKKCIEYA